MRSRGNVLIKDFLQKSAENLTHEQSELIINPITMDQTIQYEIKERAEDESEEEPRKTVLQCLIGAKDGAIYIYDPVLLQKSAVLSYNSDPNMPYFKARRPEIVRWVEPSNLTSPITQVIQQENGQTKTLTQQVSAKKFAVVFDDGCIYLYEKDVPYSAKEDYRKSMMQITTNQGKETHKDGKNMISKSDVI